MKTMVERVIEVLDRRGLDESVVEVIEMDNHINDEEFGEKLAQTLLNLLPDQG